MKRKTKTYFTDFFSLNEARVSVLMFLLLMFSFTLIILILFRKDIPEVIAEIIRTLIFTVAGLNATDQVLNSNLVSKKTNDDSLI